MKQSFKTHDQVIRLSKADKTYEAYRDTAERGKGRLGVRVSPKGTKTWLYRYFSESKPKFIKLGLVSDHFPMTHAQILCDEYADMIARGIDPKVELERRKRAEAAQAAADAKQGSLGELFAAYTNKMKEDGKRTYPAVLAALKKEVYPLIPPTTKAKDVQPTDVVAILSGMIQRGSRTQSNRVRSYLVAAFNYGLRHDLDPAVAVAGVAFGLASNPAQIVPRQASAERVGDNWLKLEEVHQLFRELKKREGFKMGESIALLIQLCFHTGGQRPYELAASRWDAIDFEQKTWLIAPEISKNKRPHLIPITDTAIALLCRQKELGRSLSPFIFNHHQRNDTHLRLDSLSKAIGRYCEWQASELKKATDNGMEGQRQWVHKFVSRDIRRTCKTLMGELGISKETRDRLQNHALNDVSSKHYDRYSYAAEKRQALEAWEARLNQTASGANVVQFGGGNG